MILLLCLYNLTSFQTPLPLPFGSLSIVSSCSCGLGVPVASVRHSATLGSPDFPREHRTRPLTHMARPPVRLPAKQTRLRGTPPFPSDSFPTPSSTSLNYHVCRRLPGGWLLSSQLSTGHFPLTILPVSRAQHGFLPVLQQLFTEQSHRDHALPISSPSPLLLDGPQPLLLFRVPGSTLRDVPDLLSPPPSMPNLSSSLPFFSSQDFFYLPLPSANIY